MRIEQINEGIFRVGPGWLFPAFSRMESAGHISSEWHATEKNRRAKYYRLTSSGRKALKLETHTWEQQTAAITRILEA
jgi:DNA-binding PadR family transcriptional regulator